MKVFVNYNDKRWKKYNINFEKIANAVVGIKYKKSEVSITLVDDDEIHALNKMYRDMDKPTNVLSFELGDDILLGDIYISLDTVVREAKDAKISVEDHVAHMVVHGMFHLLGYDHLTDAQAKVMESKEIAVLKKLRIKNPYMDENTKKFAWWKYLLCALFGGVASLGFAPFNMWWVTVLAIAGAYWLLCLDNEKIGFWRAWLRAMPFGAMYSISMFWWTVHSIYVVPEITKQFAVWTVPALIGIGIFGIIFFVIPYVLTQCIYTKSGVKPFVFAFGCTFVLWLREWFLTGFPWNPISNITLSSGVISNSMSLFGALGLTFVITGMIASVVQILHNRANKVNWVSFGFFFILLCVGMGYGYNNISVSNLGENSIVVRIVQPVTTQESKIALSRADALNRAEARVEELVKMAGDVSNVDVALYPETSYPFALMPDDYMPIAKQLKIPVLIGANVVDYDRKVYNALAISDSSGKMIEFYGKSHLVPFGEYGPIKFVPTPANLTSGGGARTIALQINKDKKFVFAPAVCYEIIFSDAVIKDEVADAIINVSNDTWFGATPGTYQHMDMARRGAIEYGMPVIRANYSGISAFIGADGKIISSLPIGQSGVLDGTVRGSHMTLYRLLGRDAWFLIILMISVIGGFIAYRIEKKK